VRSLTNYFFKFTDEFALKHSPIPEWQLESTKVAKVISVFAIAVPVLVYISGLHYPEVKAQLVSWIFEDPSSTSIWIRLILELHMSGLLLVFWAGYLVHIAIMTWPILSSVFLISEIT